MEGGGMWLSLMIGNSRLHWALLEKDAVLEIWDTGHLGKASLSEGSGGVIEEGIPLSFISARARHMLRGDGSVIGSVSGTPETIGPGTPPTEGENGGPSYVRVKPRRFRVASVVPKELEAWLRQCPGIITLSSREAIEGVEEYPTLGVDRALAVRGAARVRGWPVMVVDCGSALTFTAVDASGRLGGGAILPGVRLQLVGLGTRTAQLPSDVVLPDELPARWAMGTSGGIQAGVMWTIVAGIQSFIKDRWKIDPDATVVFTGGDGQVLHRAVLESWDAECQDLARMRDRIQFVRELIHWGIASVALGTPINSSC